ncbi:MAG: DUF945 family protein [Pseudomonadota bacterium]
MLRKLLLLLAVVILLFAGLAPGAVGWGIAKYAPAAIEQQGPALGLDDLRVVHEGGWFTSRLRLSGTRDGQALEIDAELDHGPWTGMPPGLLKGDLVATLGAEPLATGYLAVGLRGGVHLRLRPAGERGGGDLVVNVRELGRTVDLQAEALSVSPWFDTLDGDARLEQGETTGRITGRFQAAVLRAEAMRLRGAAFDFTVLREAENLSLTTDGTVKTVVEDGDPWRGIEFGVTLGRLHAPTLGSLLRGLRAVNGSATSEEARSRAATGVVVTALPALLFNQPAIERFEFRGKAPVGPFDLAASARLTAPPPSGFISDFLLLRDVLAAEGQAQLSREWVETLIDRRLVQAFGDLEPEALGRMRELTLGEYLTSGMLERREKGYCSAFEFSEGALTINGIPALMPGG